MGGQGRLGHCCLLPLWAEPPPRAHGTHALGQGGVDGASDGRGCRRAGMDCCSGGRYKRLVRLAEDLQLELNRLAADGLLRARRSEVESPSDREELVDACTNDYLGYGRADVSRETGARSGASASRLVFGTQPEHQALEAELSSWLGTEDALLFSSGYAANLGTVAALAGPGDLIVSDRLNHASIVDGCRLSRATVRVIPHRNLEAADLALQTPTAGRRWLVTEAYFSMDGDSPDLGALRTICDARGAALLVDEAHSLGIFGPEGGGLCRQAGVLPDVFVGGFGKALGVQGAFVAGSSALIRFLWNRARTFVFSTAPSPVLAAMILAHVKAVRVDDASRARLASLCSTLADALRPIQSRLPVDRHGPIFPVVLGTPERALAVAASLRDRGFLAQAIRPPTVPPGESRVRVALHADLRTEDVLRLAAVLSELCPA
jgi:8-amino-7-oxononanoate synthase